MSTFTLNVQVPEEVGPDADATFREDFLDAVSQHRPWPRPSGGARRGLQRPTVRSLRGH